MSVGNNVPELTVSELAYSLKKTLEDTYARVRVRGELSKVKVHISGHLYSDLKDADSVLNIICWKGSLAKLAIRPEEGLDVICTGRITSYPARSNYQMVVEHMELAGAGALLKMLEDRKKRLAAEGLFDPSRKQKLPFLPEVIGVVTSPTGAVIRDILHRLQDRFPRRVIVWPVRVQGETSAAEVAAAIQGFNAMEKGGALPRPDVLIVARGGGSIEDLWSFNEEIVVRAAAASEIPLISAGGHETDTTLIDFAADRRAPTPTAAAEMAVPVRGDLIADVRDKGTRLMRSEARLVEDCRTRLSGLARGLPKLADLVALPRQRFDNAADKLGRALIRATEVKGAAFHRIEDRLSDRPIRQKIAAERKALPQLLERLSRAETRHLGDLARRLD